MGLILPDFSGDCLIHVADTAGCWSINVEHAPIDQGIGYLARIEPESFLLFSRKQRFSVRAEGLGRLRGDFVTLLCGTSQGLVLRPNPRLSIGFHPCLDSLWLPLPPARIGAARAGRGWEGIVRDYGVFGGEPALGAGLRGSGRFGGFALLLGRLVWC